MARLVDLGRRQLSPSPTSSSSVRDQYLADIPAADTASCGGWPHCAALGEGRAVADMPFGDGDPWRACGPQFAGTTAPARYRWPTNVSGA